MINFQMFKESYILGINVTYCWTQFAYGQKELPHWRLGSLQPHVMTEGNTKAQPPASVQDNSEESSQLRIPASLQLSSSLPPSPSSQVSFPEHSPVSFLHTDPHLRVCLLWEWAGNEPKS